MADLAEQGHVPLRAPDRTVDLIVIGAGPAGMAAAVEARRHGMSVLLLDEQETPGGQIYRRVTQADEDRRRILGPDYARGSDLAREFTVSGAEYWPRTAVWQVTRERRVHALRDGRVAALEARAIVLATGAMERPFPIPGWTLSGVMTAGAAQILMKSAGIVPGQAPVLAGCGPLLYLLAWQYLRAGVRIGAILDTAAPADLRAALRHASGALAGWPDLVKGLKLLSGIKRHRVPHYKGVTGLAIQGEDGCAQRIRFQADGRTRTLPASLVLLHQGVVPNTQITWSLRAGHVWDDAQLCWRPVVDGWGELDVPGIYVAGDGAAIAGGAGGGDPGPPDGPGGRRRGGAPDRGATRCAGGAPGARAPFVPSHTALPRSPVPAEGREPHPRRRGHGVPLRRGHGGAVAGRRAAGVRRTEPGQVVQPLRNGALPGAPVRPDGDGTDRGHAPGAARRCRLLSHPPADQADHAGAAGERGRGQ